VGGLLVFVSCITYVVNTLFIHPGKNVDFGIFYQAGFFQLAGLFLVLAILSVINLALESYKWWVMTRKIENITYPHAFNSVLTGLAMGFITPNRLGDFPGRAILYSTGNRTQVVLMNLLSGYAQFVVICLLGLLSLCLIPAEFSWYTAGSETWRWLYMGLLLLLLVFHLLVMFNTRSFIQFFARFKWLKKVTDKLENFPALRPFENIVSIHLSLLRSLVYTAQLVMLLYFLDDGVSPLQWLLYTNVYFFVLTVAPSFMLNKLGVRESLAVVVFADLCQNPVVPVVAVLLLWIMNQVVPAMAGAYILFKKGRA